jgi:hypothetical protein
MSAISNRNRLLLSIALIGVLCVTILYIEAKPTGSYASIDFERLETVSNPNGFEIGKPGNWISVVQGHSILIGQSFNRHSDYYSVAEGGDFTEKIEHGKHIVFCNSQALFWQRETGGETFESPLRTTGTIRAKFDGRVFVFRFSFKGNDESRLSVLMRLLQTFKLSEAGANKGATRVKGDGGSY